MFNQSSSKAADMLLFLPMIVAATLSRIAVSDAIVPQYDIARECQFEGPSIVEFGRCSKREHAAFLQLQNNWAQFTAADKRNCTASTKIGDGFENYVELLTCLEMARDVNNENHSSGGRESTGSVDRYRATPE